MCIHKNNNNTSSSSNLLSQVYNDFHTAVSAFQDVPYDIMDIRARRFDDDFYEFRCKIKELERRLGSAITQVMLVVCVCVCVCVGGWWCCVALKRMHTHFLLKKDY